MVVVAKRLTVERVVPHSSLDFSYLDHIARYNFLKDMVLGKVVLDVGCGSGYGTNILAKHAKKVIGIDIFHDSIAYAKEKFKAKDIEFIQMDCLNLKFKNETFDVICSFEVIEHLDDFQKYLTEMNRVLRKEGIFAVSTPNNKNNQHPSHNPFHKKEFSCQEFKVILAKWFRIEAFYGETADENLKGAMNAFRRFYNPINKLDIFKIRKLIPDKIRKQVVKLLIKKNSNIDVEKLGAKNIIIDSTDAKNAETLFAICRKK